MSVWLKRVNRDLKSYSRELYAELSSDGIPCVFHRRTSVQRHVADGCVIFQFVNRPDLVFALTDTWLINGTPAEWGAEPLIAKLKSCDQEKRDVFGEMNSHNEKVDLSKQRDFSNKLESWAYDFRKVFARETNHIVTSQIKSDFEFEKRKENFYGNC